MTIAARPRRGGSQRPLQRNSSRVQTVVLRLPLIPFQVLVRWRWQLPDLGTVACIPLLISRTGSEREKSVLVCNGRKAGPGRPRGSLLVYAEALLTCVCEGHDTPSPATIVASPHVMQPPPILASEDVQPARSRSARQPHESERMTGRPWSDKRQRTPRLPSILAFPNVIQAAHPVAYVAAGEEDDAVLIDGCSKVFPRQPWGARGLQVPLGATIITHPNVVCRLRRHLADTLDITSYQEQLTSARVAQQRVAMPWPEGCILSEKSPPVAVCVTLPDVTEVDGLVRSTKDDDLLRWREHDAEVHAGLETTILAITEQRPRSKCQQQHRSRGPTNEEQPEATAAEVPTPFPLELLAFPKLPILAERVLYHGHVDCPALAGCPHFPDETFSVDRCVRVAAEHTGAHEDAAPALRAADAPSSALVILSPSQATRAATPRAAGRPWTPTACATAACCVPALPGGRA
mmetsp:Transcript_25015/g.63185  ORF Transcript_25015/g.63185 Transcript_25015/m.63185 type:complete len:462 (-) Transcript_25015:179-1564(-)